METRRVLNTPGRVIAASLLVLLLGSSCDSSKRSDAHDDAALDPVGSDDAGSEALDAGSVADDGPVVTGPITTGMGKAFSTSGTDLGAHGYLEEEFFFAGSAASYSLTGDMTMDGRWTAAEAARAPYKSRLLVRRPADKTKFNGTVIVEWLNVSGGVDADPGYTYTWEEILRAGYVWVGISAQQVGIQGGGFSLTPEAAVPLKMYDPERYGSLAHPGDDYSYDIYTQAARVVRTAREVHVLGGLKPERLIAYGESQSAMRMVTYVNAVHPLVKAFDAYFIHSRGGNGAPLAGSTGGLPSFGGAPIHIRTDIDAPVFQFQTETDVFGLLAYYPARQPDNQWLRTWEVSGTAHADSRFINENSTLPCTSVNDGPQHFVLKGALHALDVWLQDGSAPAKGELFQNDDTGKPKRDEHGNMLGGVRTPDVDVPVSTLSGDGDPAGGILCSLFGHTTLFPPAKLKQLYPTHEDYVSKVTAAARAAREASFILAEEEAAFVAEAQAARVPE